MDGLHWRALASTVAFVVVLGAVVLAVPDLRDATGAALRGDADRLRDQLRDLGATGVAVLLTVQLAHAVVLYPAEIVTAAAGFVYGFALGLPLVMAGWLLNGWAAYAIGRHAGRSALRRVAGGDRFDRAEAAIERGGVRMLLAARLIPVLPFSIVGYVAGAARVPLWRYTWTTLVGYLPLCAATIWFGERLDRLSWTDPSVWVLVAVFVSLLALAPWAARRFGLRR